MADFSALKQSIQNYIKQNGNKEITGNLLQTILLSMVTTMGDGAINDNASDISDIQNEIQNITGALYAGYATPSTMPAALTGQEVFYIATQAGTYTNFHFNGGDDPIVLAKDGIYFIVSGNDDDDWNAEPMLQLDDVPTASSNNAVKSGGVAEELALGAVYDVSAKNPTAGHNNDGKWESLSALLSDANLNTIIPTSVRKGGMSIKFVQSSDNKYAQYRLMADEWSTDTEDWAIGEEGVYVENPEFVYVKTDKDNKILWAIKTDGGIYYGAGVPQQVIDCIEEKIADLSLDKYEDIVAFLSDYLGSDTTLKVMIDEINDTKLDKDGLDPDALKTVQAIENPEYIQVATDSEDNILEGITLKGVKKINLPIDTPSATVKHIENPEWMDIETDIEGRIIEGTRKNGKKVFPGGIEGLEEEIQNTVNNTINTEFANKSTTDKFSEQGGQLLWNGEPVKSDSISSLVVDLPVSDGTDIESGYAYIDITDRTIKVKA